MKYDVFGRDPSNRVVCKELVRVGFSEEIVVDSELTTHCR